MLINDLFGILFRILALLLVGRLGLLDRFLSISDHSFSLFSSGSSGFFSVFLCSLGGFFGLSFVVGCVFSLLLLILFSVLSSLLGFIGNFSLLFSLVSLRLSSLFLLLGSFFLLFGVLLSLLRVSWSSGRLGSRGGLLVVLRDSSELVLEHGFDLVGVGLGCEADNDEGRGGGFLHCNA